MEWLGLCVSALLVGLAGGLHCWGMCGGIISALSFATPDRNPTLIVGYSLGRLTTYALLGALVSALVGLGREFAYVPMVARLVAGVLLILMGAYLLGWSAGLAWLERCGAKLWRYLEPLAGRLLPVRTLPAAVGFGLVWGWLPCGLVYSALALSATAMNPWIGALVMVSFGVGTLPAVLAAGFFSQQLGQWLRRRALRWAFALSLMGFGVWTAISGLSHRHETHQGGMVGAGVTNPQELEYNTGFM